YSSGAPWLPATASRSGFTSKASQVERARRHRPGGQPARPFPLHVRRLSETILFAGVPFVGENSMLSLSSSEPVAASASRPFGVVRTVILTLPAWRTATRPCAIRSFVPPFWL